MVEHVNNGKIAHRVFVRSTVISLSSPLAANEANAAACAGSARRTWLYRIAGQRVSMGMTKAMYCRFFSSQPGCSHSIRHVLEHDRPWASVSKVRTVFPRNSCMLSQSLRQVPAGSRSRWKVSPASDRVTAPLELMTTGQIQVAAQWAGQKCDAVL